MRALSITWLWDGWIERGSDYVFAISCGGLGVQLYRDIKHKYVLHGGIERELHWSCVGARALLIYCRKSQLVRFSLDEVFDVCFKLGAFIVRCVHISVAC